MARRFLQHVLADVDYLKSGTQQPAGEVPGGLFTAGRVHLARLSAARRARQVLRAAADAAAAAALERGASYPMLAAAGGRAAGRRC